MLSVMFLIIVLVNIHEAVFVPKEKYNKTLQVVTTTGTIQGQEDVTDAGVSYFAFNGIPFAQPPLNNLRFRSPVPSKKWRGVLDGARIMPGCVESVIRLSNFTIQGEEDCLYLNIYTPRNPNEVENLPVMLWLYGGAFIEGNSTLYGPQYFMEKNVILVTTNYRLGIFGFLSTEDEASPGNYGLKDQLAALKWLNKNIKYFGGDPKKITIFGQSSGACSVMHHLASDKSRGLFSGAIVMSGDALAPWCTQRYPLNVAVDVGEALHLETTNTTKFVNALRKVDGNLLKRVQLDVGFLHFASIYHDGLPFTPTIEPEHKDAFITEPFYNKLKRGDIAKVPIVIGRTSLELHILATALPLLRTFCLLLDTSPSSIVDRFSIPDDRKHKVGEMIKKQYFASGSATSATAEEILHFFTDVAFDIPLERSIQLLSQHTPVYKYIFSYETKSFPEFLGSFFHLRRVESIKGVNHATEIPLIFKIANVKINDPKDILFRERVTTLWSNFAKYGNPTPRRNDVLQNIIWPPITNPKMVSYLDIGNNLRIKKRYGRENFVKFWNKLYSTYILKPYF